MQRNILILIVSFIIYVGAFQLAGQIVKLYVLHVEGPVLPIILIEQSLIPFIFGFYTYKYISSKKIFSPVLVLFIPISLILPTTIWDIIKGENVTIFEHTFMFSVVVILQLTFITLGAYLQFYKKNK